MIRKVTLYTLALFAWLLASAGVTIAAYAGEAEPYLSTPPLVVGEFTPFVVIVGAWVAGGTVVKLLKIRDWRSTGRRATLAPEGGGLFGYPEFTGTVGGRTVRARTVERRTSSGGQGSSTTTYTVVEADLDRASEAGVMIGPAGGARTSKTSTTVGFSAEEADVADGELAAKGSSEAVARAVTAGRARDALLAMDDLDLVYAGDVAGVMTDEMGDMSDVPMGGMLADKVYDRIPGDASRVSTETKKLVLDADRLRRQTEAVAAVADAFEDATASR